MKEFNDKEWEAFCKTWSNEPEKKKITGCDAFLIFFFVGFIIIANLVAWGVIW